MKQKEVFKKIGSIIKELNDQYEYLETATGELNELELELFVSNAHFLADHIEILCKLNVQNKKSAIVKSPPVITQENIPEKRFFEPVVQQMRYGAGVSDFKAFKKPIEQDVPKNKGADTQPTPQIDLHGEERGDSYSYIREEPETIRHELILDESGSWDEDEADPGIETINDPDKKAETASPQFKLDTGATNPTEFKQVDENSPAQIPVKKDEDGVVTINQKISSQLADKNNSNTEQLAIKPISDIKLAITLNDKLLYVKDLFNGYNLAYSEAIEILNRFNTFEEASRFLKTNYVVKNNWETKPVTTEKFYTLLKRRYA